MEEKRTKVILRNTYLCDETNLLLTDDQIRLLQYLYDEDLLIEDIKYEVLAQEKDWQKI